jgi:hypothetical protein
VIRIAQVGRVAALVGGLAWTIKAGLIILMNAHFQPVEGVLYFIGVGGILIGAFGLAAFIGLRWTGVARWIVFAVAIAAALFITSFASGSIQTVVADAYTGNNVGIEEEIGILVPGVIWLAVGLFLWRSSRAGEARQSRGA